MMKCDFDPGTRTCATGLPEIGQLLQKAVRSCRSPIERRSQAIELNARGSIRSCLLLGSNIVLGIGYRPSMQRKWPA